VIIKLEKIATGFDKIRVLQLKQKKYKIIALEKYKF